MQGYIKLYRKTMCSPIWQDPYYFKLWMYCLMKASHKEHDLLVGNKIIKLSPGEFVTGRSALADDLNRGMKPKQKQSEISWWRYLNNLEQWGMLNIKKTNKYSVVSIVKWHEYQETEQQLNNNRTTTEQQLNTNKNGKNGKNNISRQKFKYEPSDMELAKLLFGYIEDNVERAFVLQRVNIESWANEIRLMRERDKRTTEQIKYLIDWTQKDDFWKTNILSPSKLREKFDQLVLKVKQQKGVKKPTQTQYQELKQGDFMF